MKPPMMYKIHIIVLFNSFYLVVYPQPCCWSSPNHAVGPSPTVLLGDDQQQGWVYPADSSAAGTFSTLSKRRVRGSLVCTLPLLYWVVISSQ